MLIKEKRRRKRNFKILTNSNKKVNSNNKNIYKNRDPAFQINKTLRKYIFDKLQANDKLPVNESNKIKDNKKNEFNKKIKIEVNRKIKHSKSSKLFSSINTPKAPDNNTNNYIYYKKNSKILSFLKSIQSINIDKNNNIFNTNKSCFSENNSKYNINNNDNKYKYNTIRYNCSNKYYNNNCNKELLNHKYSSSTFSSTISYKDMNNNSNNKIQNLNKISSFSLSPTISKEKIKCNLTSRLPYRRVGNIFNRSECQFTKNKIKNNIELKNKLFKKCKSVKYYQIYSVNKRNKINFNNKNKIKELEDENIYLKKIILLSEKKLKMRKTQLDKLLMLQNQVEDKNCPVPMKQIKKIDSPITEIIEKQKKNIKANLNKNTGGIKNDNIQNEILLFDYLEEPLEQVPPKPYILSYCN